MFWDPLPGDDADAIHDNVAGEFAAVTEKITPVSGDLLLIEDSAASNAKKRLQIGNLPSGGGGGGAVDPITEKFGAADTAYEFDSSDLSGFTVLNGSPAAEDANTSVPGHYFIRDAGAAFNWRGRYIAIPSAPFTAIMKVSDHRHGVNWMRTGLFIGVATPGNMDMFAVGSGSRNVVLERQTPTAHGSTIVTDSKSALEGPIWLAIRVNSSSNCDYAYTSAGYVWKYVVFGRNPGLTLGSLGWGLKAENAADTSTAIDYVRIWNSALALPA